MHGAVIVYGHHSGFLPMIADDTRGAYQWYCKLDTSGPTAYRTMTITWDGPDHTVTAVYTVDVDTATLYSIVAGYEGAATVVSHVIDTDGTVTFTDDSALYPGWDEIGAMGDFVSVGGTSLDITITYDNGTVRIQLADAYSIASVRTLADGLLGDYQIVSGEEFRYETSPGVHTEETWTDVSYPGLRQLHYGWSWIKDGDEPTGLTPGKQKRTSWPYAGGWSHIPMDFYYGTNLSSGAIKAAWKADIVMETGDYMKYGPMLSTEPISTCDFAGVASPAGFLDHCSAAQVMLGKARVRNSEFPSVTDAYTCRTERQWDDGLTDYENYPGALETATDACLTPVLTDDLVLFHPDDISYDWGVLYIVTATDPDDCAAEC